MANLLIGTAIGALNAKAKSSVAPAVINRVAPMIATAFGGILVGIMDRATLSRSQSAEAMPRRMRMPWRRKYRIRTDGDVVVFNDDVAAEESASTALSLPSSDDQDMSTETFSLSMAAAVIAAVLCVGVVLLFVHARLLKAAEANAPNSSLDNDGDIMAQFARQFALEHDETEGTPQKQQTTTTTTTMMKQQTSSPKKKKTATQRGFGRSESRHLKVRA